MSATMAGIGGSYGFAVNRITNGWMVSIAFQDPDYKGPEDLAQEIVLHKLPETPPDDDGEKLRLLYKHFQSSESMVAGHLGGSVDSPRKTVNLYAADLAAVQAIFSEYESRVPEATEGAY